MNRIVMPILMVLLYCLTVAQAEPPAPIFPEALKPGDVIMVTAPAKPLDRDRVERAARRLETMGFQVIIPDNLYRKRGYLAGTDEERASEIMAAFSNPKVKAIFPGTGGFGTTRFLDRLDYDVIRRNPKILIGFSDITGLHLAIQQKTGLVTFHSPVLMFGLGNVGNLSPFSAECFWRALLKEKYFDKEGQPFTPGYDYPLGSKMRSMRTLVPGVARGRLTGGNLSLVCALMGTPYEIQTEGRILFLEDVGEEPYRIDRYFSQLRLAGKLDAAAGIILGVFSGCEPRNPAASLSLEQVFEDYFADLGVPVLMHFPVGHTGDNATLPMNVLAELDAGEKRLTLLENPVSLSSY